MPGFTRRGQARHYALSGGGHHGGHHGGGGHHHHGGHGGGRWWGGPSWYPYPYPVDCVRDPEDLRRCLPPEALYGTDADGLGASEMPAGVGVLLALGALYLGLQIFGGKKR